MFTARFSDLAVLRDIIFNVFWFRASKRLSVDLHTPTNSQPLPSEYRFEKQNEPGHEKRSQALQSFFSAQTMSTPCLCINIYTVHIIQFIYINTSSVPGVKPLVIKEVFTCV